MCFPCIYLHGALFCVFWGHSHFKDGYAFSLTVFEERTVNTEMLALRLFFVLFVWRETGTRVILVFILQIIKFQ